MDNLVASTSRRSTPYGGYGARSKQVERQRLLAESLRKQAQQELEGSYTQPIQGSAEFGPLPQQYVAPSWSQQLARGLQAYESNRLNRGADVDEANNEQQAREEAQNAMTTLPSLDTATAANDMLQWGATQDPSNPYLADTAGEVRKGGLALALAELRAKRGLSGGDSGIGPAAVQEYKYYAALPEAEKQQYQALKRAQQQSNFGGAIGYRNPVTGEITYVSKTPTPDAMLGAEASIRAAASTPEATQAFIDQAQGDTQQAAALKEQWVAAQVSGRTNIVGSPPPQQPAQQRPTTGFSTGYPVFYNDPTDPTKTLPMGAPGTTLTDVQEGTMTDESVAVLSPRQARPLTKQGHALPRTAGSALPPLTSPVDLKSREAEASAGGTARGKAQEEAKQLLPGLESNITMVDRHISEIQKMPGYKDIGSAKHALGKTITGATGVSTTAGDIENRIAQLKAEALGPAYDMLRGTGAIATAEGEAATRAYNRATSATSVGEFTKALQDFSTRLKALHNVQKIKAAGGLVDRNMSNIGQPPSKVNDLLEKYKD